MDMICSSIQVSSVKDFNYNDFRELFSEARRSGFIETTENGRIYHVKWDTETNTISVERDLTNVDGWTRISEVIDRLLKWDTVTNAKKLENRLAIQKYNVIQTKPLQEKVQELLINIEKVVVDIEPQRFASTAVEGQIKEISTALFSLFKEKKQALYERAQQLSFTVNEDIGCSQIWTKERNTNGTLTDLNHQLQQLEKFISGAKNTVLRYSVALGSVDVSKSSRIYDAIVNRLTATVDKVILTADVYFKPPENGTKADIAGHNKIIANERIIASALSQKQAETHFTYNELLSPPCYPEKDGRNATQQRIVELHYDKHVMEFIDVLSDPTNSFVDIQNAANNLRAARDRWTQMIKLQEEICTTLTWLSYHEGKYPVYLKHNDQLMRLYHRFRNSGQLLSMKKFEQAHTEYKNIQRANQLYLEIEEFLNKLPGSVCFLGRSSYSEEMQSRILHLSVLKNMCEKESLDAQSVEHMEHFTNIHKNIITYWIDADFSHFTTYDLIPNNVDYPVWLIKENESFRSKCKELNELCFETKYQLLRNEELMKIRGEELQKLRVDSKQLDDSATKFAKAAARLHQKYDPIEAARQFFIDTFWPESEQSSSGLPYNTNINNNVSPAA